MIQYETKIKLRQTEQAQEVIKVELEQSRIVEEVRQGKRLEELRAKQGVDAAIQAEIVQKNADASFYSNVRMADAKLYEKQKEAEGIKVLADSRKKALAQYTEVLKEPNTLLNYIMMERGLFQQMAEINSDAIQGLNPQITVWNTGGSGDGKGGQTTDPYAPIRNVFSAMPPLYTMVQEQTGVSAPARK
jgi:flotillin